LNIPPPHNWHVATSEWDGVAPGRRRMTAAEGREKQINEMTQLLNAEKTSRTHAGTAE
jgi:hypothetical protein